MKVGIDRWVNDVRQLVTAAATPGRIWPHAQRHRARRRTGAGPRDITTDGLANRPVGEFRAPGMLANANSQARCCTSRTARLYLHYMQALVRARWRRHAGARPLDGEEHRPGRRVRPEPERDLSDAARCVAQLGRERDASALLATTTQMWDTMLHGVQRRAQPDHGPHRPDRCVHCRWPANSGSAAWPISDIHWLMQTMAFPNRRGGRTHAREVQAWPETRVHADRRPHG